MNFRFQVTPDMKAAWLCALLLCLAWLALVRPAPVVLAGPRPAPPVIAYLPGGGEEVRSVLSPVLFALPSPSGFSRGLPDDRIDMRLALELAQQPARYLPRPAAAPVPVVPPALVEGLAQPADRLPVPGPPSAARPARPSGTAPLFFSPELKARAAAGTALPAGIAPTNRPAGALRAHLTVRSDGTVARVLFDAPPSNPALLSALRRLRFSPAAGDTEGWLDIQFHNGNEGTQP